MNRPLQFILEKIESLNDFELFYRKRAKNRVAKNPRKNERTKTNEKSSANLESKLESESF